MNTKKQLYRMDNDGNLTFQPLNKLHKDRYKPDSVLNYTCVLMLVLMTTIVTDFAGFSSLFSKLFYDSIVLRYISILGLILATDVSPAYLGYSLKKRACGYNVETITIIAPLVALVLGLTINAILRLASHEIAFPDLGNLNTSIIDGTAADTTSSQSIFYAIFFSVLPIITSLVAFAATYSMSNPLNAERKKLEKANLDLTQHLDQLESIVAEYDAEGNYHDRMLTKDEQKYQAALAMITGQEHEYYDHVRQRISEFLANPSATSYEVKYATRRKDADA